MKNTKVLFIVAIGAIIFLVLTNAATAYLLISKGKLFASQVKESVVSEAETPSPVVTETPAVSEETSTTPTGEKATSSANEDEYVLDVVYTNGRPAYSIPAGMKKIVIGNWYKGGVEIKAEDFFTTDFKTVASASLGNYKKLLGFTDQDGINYGWTIKLFGAISSSSDKYAGENVYELNWRCDNMGCFNSKGYVIADKEAGRLYLLSRYSALQEAVKTDLGMTIFTDDSSVYIAEMENPDAINLPGTDIKLEKTSSDYSSNFDPSFAGGINFNSGYTYVADSSNGKKVYISSDGCFTVFNENGGYSKYDMKLPMLVTYMASVIDVTFNDGSKNKLDYVSQPQGGCGSHGCASLVAVEPDKLEVIGKFGNGDTAYGYVVPGDYNKNDVLWKTPLKNYYLDYSPASTVQTVECGKPVIYLYPTKKTDVNVQVTPNGGFSITDPLYGDDGWKVSADPQSNLLNYTDGKTYPYLFWEGKAVYYQRPTAGFVVAQADVDSFLTDKLAKLGLIEKEINDFKEFWVPKFVDKPYYFITFLPKSDFDNLAPLKVDPKPQTVIRVFMDYEGLDAPIKVEPLKIITPKRVGFTVVEWGGALNRR